MREFAPQNCGRKGMAAKDIVIVVHNSKHGTKHPCIRFSKESAEKVSDTGYVTFAIDDESYRLYFREAAKGMGYTISHVDRSTPCVRITVKDVKEWESYIGSYSMKRDKHLKMYYIDLPHSFDCQKER